MLVVAELTPQKLGLVPETLTKQNFFELTSSKSIFPYHIYNARKLCSYIATPAPSHCAFHHSAGAHISADYAFVLPS